MLVISERKWGGNYTVLVGPNIPVAAQTIWVVIQDGKRIDSFLKLSNAKRSYPGAVVERSSLHAYKRARV